MSVASSGSQITRFVSGVALSFIYRRKTFHGIPLSQKLTPGIVARTFVKLVGGRQSGAMLDRVLWVVPDWFAASRVILKQAKVALHSDPCRRSKKNRIGTAMPASASAMEQLPAYVFHG